MFDKAKYEKALEDDLGLILQENQAILTAENISIDLEKNIYQTYYRRAYLYKNQPDKAFSNNYFFNFRNQIKDFSSEQMDTFSKGWFPDAFIDNSGRQIIQRRNYERKILSGGDYLIDRTLSNDSNDVEIRDVRVKFTDGRKMSEYFHFWGKTLPDDLKENKNQIRIYFNFNPSLPNFEENLQKFAQTFFVKFNRRKIPFQIKFALDPSKYYADNVVLYLERRYLITALDYIFEGMENFKKILRPEVPMFTYELLPGVGFAEGIDVAFFEESFGFQKTTFIIEQLKKKPTITLSELLKNIKDEYRFDSLFFLNKASRFEYNYNSVLDIIKSNDSPKDSATSYYLNLATRIGYSICKEAFWDDKGRCSWIGFATPKSYKSLDISYLDGLGGILLLLTELFGITKKPLFKRFAIGLLNTLFDRVSQEKFEIKNGFHGGTGSVLYVTKKAIIAFELKSLFQNKYDSLCNKFLELTVANQPFDVFGGMAGNLWSLLLLKQLENSNQYDSKINEYAEKLIENGLWKTDAYFLEKIVVKDKYIFMLGFPHGVTGIAYVLDLYQRIMNDTVNKKAIEDLIQQAIDYENTHRRYEDKGIWYDIYSSNGTPVADWEEGFLGIGYARIALKDRIDANLLKINLENILARCGKFLPSNLRNISTATFDFILETQKNGFTWSDSIKKSDVDSLMIDYENEILNFKSKDNKENFVHPGLIGMAGFGLSILRLHDSQQSVSYILPS